MNVILEPELPDSRDITESQVATHGRPSGHRAKNVAFHSRLVPPAHATRLNIELIQSVREKPA